MKYCVTTYSFSKHINQTKCDYFKICDLTKEMGFDGIEFIDLDRWDKELDKEKTAKEIRDYCDKIGLEIVSYTISADFLNRENEVERVKSCVDIAEILGAKVMRHDVTYALKQEPLYTYKNAIKAKITPLVFNAEMNGISGIVSDSMLQAVFGDFFPNPYAIGG